MLTPETIPTPIFSLLLILIAAALLYNRISLTVCTCSVDDAAHEEGEDELGQEHHAGHDGNVRPDTSNLIIVLLLLTLDQTCI